MAVALSLSAQWKIAKLQNSPQKINVPMSLESSSYHFFFGIQL